jgi:hypothetical protein
MRTFLALDLSLSSTGFALWSEGMERPATGTWQLATSIAWAARGYVRLQRNIHDIHKVSPIDEIGIEEALPPWAVHGQTNIKTLKAAAGMAAHAQSFAEAVGCRCREVNQATWRRHFLGVMKRGTKTKSLKDMAIQRCRELGIDVRRHDAAEAAGLLDYLISTDGIIPPWRNEHLLVEQFGARR